MIKIDLFSSRPTTVIEDSSDHLMPHWAMLPVLAHRTKRVIRMEIPFHSISDGARPDRL
jgi:hypothetical protein